MSFMSTAPAFPSFPMPQPPDWLLRELEQRVVLLLNHVLQQEPQAVERLVRQKGQTVRLEYAPLVLNLRVTPAGLLDAVADDAQADLSLKVLSTDPLSLVQTLLRGDKPRIDVSGDVMLAAEVNWLVDHVRWDVEEDLSRIVGDVPAHGMMRALKTVGEALKTFLSPVAAKMQGEEGSPRS